MVYYVKQGKVPRYRHTYDDRKNLLREELFGEESFEGLYSLLYHRNEPTRVLDISEETKREFDPSGEKRMIHRHLKTSKLAREGDPVSGRRYLFYNDRVRIGLVKPSVKMKRYFRHALFELLFFLHRGKATFSSVFGTMQLETGDYLYIPKGTTWTMSGTGDLELLFMESRDRIDIPVRYRNGYGQLREGTPYYTRDIRHPELDAKPFLPGKLEVMVDYDDTYLIENRDREIYDLEGWDGYLFPYAINISDMAPIVGKLHQPPPVHETFSGKSFMVGTFLPRLFDFHPRSIPISYYHNNIDTDEFLFYSSGSFMSRKGIEEGSITLHVRGIIHGPQPGAIEAAIGAKSTDEVAVMIEAYDPLFLTRTAMGIEDKTYMKSWIG